MGGREGGREEGQERGGKPAAGGVAKGPIGRHLNLGEVVEGGKGKGGGPGKEGKPTEEPKGKKRWPACICLERPSVGHESMVGVDRQMGTGESRGEKGRQGNETPEVEYGGGGGEGEATAATAPCQH